MSEVEKYVGEEEEEEETFVAVEDEPQPGKEEGQADEDEDDDHDEEETRLGGGREEDDEDAKKARRREENKSRRQRQREARDRTERELNFLRNRNEDLERRFSRLESDVTTRVTGNEIGHLDGQINKAKSDLQLANQVIQQAIDQQDGANVTEALDHRDTLRDHLRELEQTKDYISREAEEGGDEEAPQLDPRHVAHAQQFMLDNEWWDPQGRDNDSRKVLRVDHALVGEGYDPKTKEYWDELKTRVKEELPHHFEAEGDETDDDAGGADRGNGKPDSKRRQTQGPQFRTGGRERPLKENEVYISPERKEAMIEAGVWEDPKLRNKYLKAYAEYDKQEGA